MNMFEEARALSGTIKMRGISQSEMARMLGVSQSYVANKLRLLGIEESLKEKICEANLTERHARAILRLRDEETRKKALSIIIERGLNVAQSEALVELLHEPIAPRVEKNGTALSKIESFKKNLAESVTQLRSLGVEASVSRSYYGTKLYITVTLDEGLS